MTTTAILKPAEPKDESEPPPKERRCLKCGTRFASHSFGERICRLCKSSSSWRAGLK